MEEEKDDDNLVYFGCRWEAEQLRFAEELSKEGIFGRKKSSVMRGIVAYAMNHMAETGFRQKYREMRRAPPKK